MSKSKVSVSDFGELREAFTVSNFLDDQGVFRSSGEIWFDRAGNECFFRENGTLSCKTVNNEPTMAIQSEKDSCDFNLIYAKYSKTGLMTNMRTTPGTYGDFSSAVDYHDSVLRAQQAEDSFMTLPASIRSRFSNDPGQLIDFLANEDNRVEAIKLGLVPSSQAVQVPQDDATPPPQEGG